MLGWLHAGSDCFDCLPSQDQGLGNSDPDSTKLIIRFISDRNTFCRVPLMNGQVSPSSTPPLSLSSVKSTVDAVLTQLEKVIYGKRQTLQLTLVCLLAEGHLLLEDVPGTAKTLLAKALARAVNGSFKRIQGTPDLLPGDVTGSHLFHPQKGEFSFRPGPVFTHLLLADELNRATPRAQAALLECMAERQVSVEGQTFRLPAPFFVMATQNPIEHEGTFPLPEAQLDRFLMRLSIGYPSLEAEEEMLTRSEQEEPLDQVQPVLSPDALVALQQAVRRVHIQPSVRSYLLELVTATRTHRDLVLGAGPRATKGLFRAAQAWAAMQGRDFVIPDDIKLLVPVILGHRIILAADARLSGKYTGKILEELLHRVMVPIDRGAGDRSLPWPR